jgi:lipid-A-disaccharide synthase
VKPKSIMVIAGEASGDMLGAELVTALRGVLSERAVEAKFFGVGGDRLAAAGVEILFDFARNAVFGLEVWRRIFEFKQRFDALLKVAVERRPDLILCVDFGGFNRRFARAVKEHVRRAGAGWQPKVVQYVSPQVWASRPGRAEKMARDVDLLLAIFPFEKDWYARRVPGFAVEFVGHPVVDRYAGQVPDRSGAGDNGTRLVVLPGSRPSELRRHLPVLDAALRQIRAAVPEVSVAMVMPESLMSAARVIGLPEGVELRTDLAATLAASDVAIAKSGTITLECAVFELPTVAFYRTSALTYALASRIVNLKWIAMPNILANAEVCPEFVQGEATPGNISRAALEFITDTARRRTVRTKLREIVASLGGPGASRRAADAVAKLLLDPRSDGKQHE